MRRGAKAVVALGILAAAASSLAGGLLHLERLGYLELRRTPSAWILGTWTDEQEVETVAIVNTDTVGGTFLLGFRVFDEPPDKLPPGSTRIRLPARSIVLGRCPSAVPEVPVLFHGHPLALMSDWKVWYDTPPRIVRSGQRVTLDWCGPYGSRREFRSEVPEASGRIFFMPRKPGLSLVVVPGIAMVNAASVPPHLREKAELADEVYFTWDGKASVSLDLDATPEAPEIFDCRIQATRQRGQLEISSRILLVHRPDISVIDDR